MRLILVIDIFITIMKYYFLSSIYFLTLYIFFLIYLKPQFASPLKPSDLFSLPVKVLVNSKLDLG